MSKQQTAVEWLLNQLKERYSFMNSEPLFEQAKAMEKEQMIIFYWGGYDTGYIDNGKLGEEYYNEKYGGDQ